jgi:hypothetical protein
MSERVMFREKRRRLSPRVCCCTFDYNLSFTEDSLVQEVREIPAARAVQSRITTIRYCLQLYLTSFNTFWLATLHNYIILSDILYRKPLVYS